MEDSRSVQEFQILGGTFGHSNYWGGLVPLSVYGGYGPGVYSFLQHNILSL